MCSLTGKIQQKGKDVGERREFLVAAATVPSRQLQEGIVCEHSCGWMWLRRGAETQGEGGDQGGLFR